MGKPKILVRNLISTAKCKTTLSLTTRAILRNLPTLPSHHQRIWLTSAATFNGQSLLTLIWNSNLHLLMITTAWLSAIQSYTLSAMVLTSCGSLDPMSSSISWLITAIVLSQVTKMGLNLFTMLLMLKLLLYSSMDLRSIELLDPSLLQLWLSSLPTTLWLALYLPSLYTTMDRPEKNRLWRSLTKSKTQSP